MHLAAAVQRDKKGDFLKMNWNRTESQKRKATAKEIFFVLPGPVET